jgi:CTP:molybdopterin cytidylyltransferase MocA
VSTTAIILAADSNPEFPGPKYLASVAGEAMLQMVVDDAVTWPVDEVVVVLGADAAVIAEAIDFRGHTVIIDPEWSEGSASPLRAALDLASRDRSTHLCVIARGDQPGVDAVTVGALVDAANEEGADAVVPKYRYSVGWPVVLDDTLWKYLLGGEGTVDLLAVIASYGVSVEEVWFDHLPPTVYATPADLPMGGR